MVVSASVSPLFLPPNFDGKEKVWKIKTDSPFFKALFFKEGGRQVKGSQFAGGTSQIGCPDMVRLLPLGEILSYLSR